MKITRKIHFTKTEIIAILEQYVNVRFNTVDASAQEFDISIDEYEGSATVDGIVITTSYEEN